MGTFFQRKYLREITGKENDDLYCVYTAYEKDHTKPYTTILGHKVNSSAPLPNGLVEKLIPAQTYTMFTAKGNLQEGAVLREWQKIWNSDIGRLFSCDFEVYGSGSRDPENAEVDIYIAVN